jgi:hypothetical protein
MAKGKLSTTEKYAIQGMLADGLSVADIEEALDRKGGVAVKNYITSELDELLDTVVSARLQRVDNGEDMDKVFADCEDDYTEPYDEYEPEEERSDRGNKLVRSKDLVQKKFRQKEKGAITVKEDVARETILKLRGVGLNKRKSEEIFARAERLLNRHPRDAEEMYNFCLRQLNVLDQMITDTVGERSDEPEVAVMTGTASAVADHNRAERMKKNKSVSRTARGAVYCPKTGEYK